MSRSAPDGAGTGAPAEEDAEEAARIGAAAGAWSARAAGLADLGPFFAVRTHRPGTPPTAPWRPAAELAADPAVLRERVAAVRGRLAAGGGRPAEAVERRVAASVAHLGLAARLVSPFLALAVLYGQPPPRGLALADLHWQPVLGGPYPLSLPRYDAAAATAARAAAPEPGESRGPHAAPVSRRHAPAAPDPGDRPDPDADAAADGDPAVLAEAVGSRLFGGPVGELDGAFAGTGVSGHILRGNAASAVHGAAGMIAAARPGLGGRAHAIAALLLERPPLRGAAARTAAGVFRRRSCCLIYRAAPGRAGALCGDCVLRPEAG